MKYLNSTLVTKAKLLQAYQSLAVPALGNRRKLTVKYFANEVPPRLDDLDVSRSMAKQGVPNEAIFRLVSERSATAVFDRADSTVRRQLGEEGGYYPTDIHCHLSAQTKLELEQPVPKEAVPAEAEFSKPMLLAALGNRASEVVEAMRIRDIVSVLRSFAMLGERPDEALLQALGGRIKDAAQGMGMQELAEVLNAYGALGLEPSSAAFLAVGSRIAEVAPRMNAQNISSVINAYAVLDHLPEEQLATVLEQRIKAVATDMSPSDIASVLAAYAKLLRMRVSRDRSRSYDALLAQLPGEPVLAAMCRRAEATAPGMAASEVVLVIRAYAAVWTMVHEALATRHLKREDEAVEKKLQAMASMGASMVGALGLRLQDVAPHMRPIDVANVFEAYAKLGQTPDGLTLQALAQRLQQVVDLLSVDDVARTFAAYSKLREMQLEAQGQSQSQ